MMFDQNVKSILRIFMDFDHDFNALAIACAFFGASFAVRFSLRTVRRVACGCGRCQSHSGLYRSACLYSTCPEFDNLNSRKREKAGEEKNKNLEKPDREW